MTFSLHGLAVGSACVIRIPRRQSDKIVTGFGGTLCLVLIFLYILASVLAARFRHYGMHIRASCALEASRPLCCCSSYRCYREIGSAATGPD